MSKIRNALCAMSLLAVGCTSTSARPSPPMLPVTPTIEEQFSHHKAEILNHLTEFENAIQARDWSAAEKLKRTAVADINPLLASAVAHNPEVLAIRSRFEKAATALAGRPVAAPRPFDPTRELKRGMPLSVALPIIQGKIAGHFTLDTRDRFIAVLSNPTGTWNVAFERPQNVQRPESIVNETPHTLEMSGRIPLTGLPEFGEYRIASITSKPSS